MSYKNMRKNTKRKKIKENVKRFSFTFFSNKGEESLEEVYSSTI